jgi:hypothetical protein
MGRFTFVDSFIGNTGFRGEFVDTIDVITNYVNLVLWYFGF